VSFFIVLFAASSSAVLLNAEPPADSPPESRERALGVGVLCLWGITNGAAEIGRQCRPGQNLAFQAELERSVSRFDDYVLRNGLTPEQVAQFKREQGLSGTPQAALCTGELIAFYNHMSAQGPDGLRSEVDRLVSRPGRPSWGDCL
jgi:hypothetical protein